MKNIRKIIAGALLAIPMLSLGAADLGGRSPGTQTDETQALTCCPVRINGVYYCFPC